MTIWLSRIRQLVAFTAILAVAGVLIGSLDYHTTWEGSNGFGDDGFWQWAAFTLPLGGIALLLLLTIWEGLRDWRGADRYWLSRAGIRALFAAGCCAAAAWIANWYWHSLLGQPEDPEVTVRIAQGLPVVVTAGIVGSALAVLLAIVIWWGRGKARASLL